VIRPSFLIPLAVALSLLGCATGTSLTGYTPKTPDEAPLVTTLQRIPNGVKARSVETIMQAYDEDIFVANFHKYLGVAGVGSPTTLRGKDQVRQVYAGILRSVKDISLDVRDFRLSMSGDRAVATGWIEMTMRLEAGRGEAKSELVRNNVTWRMRRTPAGWKIAEEIFE
jgi:ketosteroid isomerase-like protein